MPNGLDEEQLRRLYHQITSSNAEAFAHEIGEVFSVNLPKSSYPRMTIYGTKVHEEDLYPNDYSTLLLGVLDSQGYSTASFPLNFNGGGNPIESIPIDLINNRTNLIVDIHISRFFGIYLAQLRERGSPKSLYACPTPPPGSLWEYQEEAGRLVQLRRTSV